MNSKKSVYWIWLSLALGEGSLSKEIIDDFGTAENIYNSNIMQWRMSPAFSPAQINKLEKTKLSAAENIIDICNKNNWDFSFHLHCFSAVRQILLLTFLFHL